MYTLAARKVGSLYDDRVFTNRTVAFCLVRAAESLVKRCGQAVCKKIIFKFVFSVHHNRIFKCVMTLPAHLLGNIGGCNNAKVVCAAYYAFYAVFLYKFKYSLVVGVILGDILVCDLVSRKIGHIAACHNIKTHCLCLFYYRYLTYGTVKNKYFFHILCFVGCGQGGATRFPPWPGVPHLHPFRLAFAFSRILAICSRGRLITRASWGTLVRVVR